MSEIPGCSRCGAPLPPDAACCQCQIAAQDTNAAREYPQTSVDCESGGESIAAESHDPAAYPLISPVPAPPRSVHPRVWPTMVMSVLVLPVAIFVQLIALVIAFAIYGDVKLLQDPKRMTDWLGELVVQPVGFLLVFLPGQMAFGGLALCGAWISRQPLLTRVGLVKSWLPWWAFPAAMLATPLVPILTTILLPDIANQPSEQLKFFEKLFQGSTGWFGVMVVLFVSVVPALSEELFFRGYVQTRLLQRWHPLAAIGFTSLLFAAAHLDPVHSVLLLPLSCWLGFVAWRAGSIWPSIGCHFANNLIASLGARLGDDPGDAFTGVVLAISGVSFAAAIYALTKFGKGRTQSAAAAESPAELPPPPAPDENPYQSPTSS